MRRPARLVSWDTPVRAASRSTTWIQAAPAADVARRQCGRVAVAGFAFEIALREPNGLAAAQVDGRQELHQAARATKLRQQCEAGRARLLRDGTGRPTARPGWPWPPPVPRSRTRRPSRRRPAARTSARNTPRAVGPGPRAARATSDPVGSSTFHCICGCFTPAGSAATVPGEDAEAHRTRALHRRFVEELEADADAEEGDAGRDGLAAPALRARSRAAPGRRRRRRPPRAAPPRRPPPPRSASVTSRAAAPTCWSAFSAERRLPMP